jgi:hypothetical protein
MNQGRTGRSATPDELTSLLALAPTLPGWVAASASIILASNVVVRVAGTEWIGSVGAHASRDRTDPRKADYYVYLTMRCSEAPRSKRGRSEVRAWQLRITDELRAMGYDAEWRPLGSGVPRFNYFHKDVATLSQIPSAIRKLQRVLASA